MPVKLIKNEGFKWEKRGQFFVKGCIGDINNIINKNIHNDINLVDLAKEMQKIDGFFSLVYEDDNIIFASVDRLRSIPLFYSLDDNEFIISDDAYYLKKVIKNKEIDNVSIDELYLTGYVTGEDTLYSNIKQIQAGECLLFFKKTLQLSKKIYFNLNDGDYIEDTIEELVRKMDTVHIKVFQKLIDSLNGRTVVLPLSGGYDSRLIAIMLQRLNYRNVICFTYGARANKEAKISEYVAKKLGYKWIFIEYTALKWRTWYESKERKNYFSYSDGLSSIPIIQDVIAVKELKEENLIPKDSIFIPGHALDFLAGSHVPEHYLSEPYLKKVDFIKQIYSKHYSLWQDDEIINKNNFIFEKKMFSRLEVLDKYPKYKAIEMYERWIWAERQSKFIANSLRVYEYYGFEWRMPLWDNELIEFWEGIKYEYKLNRNLYLKYVSDKQIIFKDLEDTSKKNLKATILEIMKMSPYIYTKIMDRRKVKSINSHPLLWYSIMSENELKNINLKKMGNINSFLSLKYKNIE